MRRNATPNLQLNICSAGAARVWIEQCLSASPWAGLAQYNTQFAALHSTLQVVNQSLKDGISCQLAVLTPDTAEQLAQTWPEQVERLGSLGYAATGWIALANDTAPYDITSPDKLKQTLRDLEVLLVPDRVASSGGRHLHHVLQALMLSDDDLPPIRSFPGGAQAVAALSQHVGQRVMACAQSTEVQGSSHARYLGPFPAPYALSTEYVVVLVRTNPPIIDASVSETIELTRQLGHHLCDPVHQARRRELGFECSL
jgi:hypothetical protein